ncbi:carbohydrate ABC transporter substrate-binding protein, CUT1 family [Micromonospora coriariae]|uniref:Carbohydrate ABC transporter substrate-binding protein, CUT1 family n=1 Tax=Micromonospora coriariae TaxID=285665 RepID=A0A1C4U6W9_9ACTN|nr:extracellular solute-binding protein [Micromonospora coriariae]SCE67463.1 carbohydrate ABC transporter substrate-binding protein, CUT1 family [Micromonospora coriariae]
MSAKPRCAVGVLAAFTAVALAATACGGSDEPAGKDAKNITLTISANSIVGGKSSAGAEWIENWVIPKFVEAQKAKGVTAKVTFVPSGVEDEQYKTKLALDLRSKGGADVIAVDGIWVGEFVQAGYLKPLSEVAGDQVDSWEGWSQIPETVQGLGSFENKRYAIPLGTDGRVLYYNKKLFARAGLPADWQPKSWQEILDAGAKLKALPGVTPIQINAGTAMGEATSMQGALPLLVGAGGEIYKDGKWAGASQPVKDMLDFYTKVYGGGLGDPKLQQEAKGRDKSFAEFAAGKIGILAEGDYFWRSVINPTTGIAKMADRDTAVGYAMIPAKQPGAGIRGQDFVSMSGGGVRALNPNSKFPSQAWELLSFMHSAEAVKAELAGEARITARQDVNKEVLAGDPMLSFITEKGLPVTAYRPPLAVYPQVSVALQEATAEVTAGKSVDEAAAAYQKKVEGIVGGAGNVTS